VEILIHHIRQLVQVRDAVPPLLRRGAMDNVPVIENAFVWIKDGVIAGYGPMEELPSLRPDRDIDATGRLVLPAWVDSHTHAVFAESRYGEFIDKIRGLSYEEIARRGGGILQSAAKLRRMSEDELTERALARVAEMMRYGTGALEMKSGYGLSVEGELKMLRVIRRISRQVSIPVRATFLGAHAVPEGMTKEAYVRMITDEMLPEIGRQQLAEYVDVFCEAGYFDLDDTVRIVKTARHYGLKPKIHVNQFHSLGCLPRLVELGAISADHLEVMTEEDFEALKDAATVATVLPGCSFFLGIPYAPARELIRRGAAVAIATDFNPGSSPSWNMNFMLSLACIKQKLTPAQALNAATVNAAHALELQHEAGSIRRGAPARLIITKPLRHYGEIPYYFATNPVEQTLGLALKGRA